MLVELNTSTGPVLEAHGQVRLRDKAQNLMERFERGDFPLQVPELRPPSSSYQPGTGTRVKQLRFAKQLKYSVKRLTPPGPVLIPELRQDRVQKR